MKICLNKKRRQYCRIEGRVVDDGKSRKISMKKIKRFLN